MSGERGDEPEGNRKECVCVVLKPDKVVSNLLPVLNVTSHLQERLSHLMTPTWFFFFSSYFLRSQILGQQLGSFFTLSTCALAKLVVPWMNFAISVAESATSPLEMKYLIPWNFSKLVNLWKSVCCKKTCSASELKVRVPSSSCRKRFLYRIGAELS